MKQFERDVNLLRAAAGVRQHDMGVMCADTQYVNQLQRDINKIPEHDGLLVFPYNEVTFPTIHLKKISVHVNLNLNCVSYISNPEIDDVNFRGAL